MLTQATWATGDVPRDDEYLRMVEHFGEAFRREVPLRYPAAEAAGNMRVIEALYRSARDGGRPCGVER